MDPKGADVVLSIFKESSAAIARANIDVSKTYTNRFVDHAGAGATPVSR